MTNLGISRSIVWNVRCHQFYYVARSIDPIPRTRSILQSLLDIADCYPVRFFSIFKIESSNFSSIGGKNFGKENLRKNKLLVQGNGGKNLKEQNGKRKKKKKKKNNQTKSDSYLMAKLLKHPPCQKIIK